MKKQLLFLALAGVALASCSSDEQVAGSAAEEANVFALRALAPGATRGTPVTTATLNTAGQNIGVQVYDNTDNSAYLTAKTFAYNATTQLFESTDHPKYKTTACTAFAWYPSTATPTFTGTFGSNLTVSQTYTPATTVSDQKDLMIANYNDVKDTEVGTGSPLTFQHALSQIVIKVKSENTTYDFQYKAAKVGNILKERTLTWPAIATGANQLATLPLTVWGTQPAHVTGNIADYATTETAQWATMTSTATTVGTAATNNDNFIIIPQDNTNAAWQKGDMTNDLGSYLAVKIQIKDKTTGNVLTSAQAHVSQDGTVWACIPVATKWEPGKRYIYTLDFTDGAGKNPDGEDIIEGEMKFKCTVSDWVDVTQNGNMQSGQTN